MDCANPGDSARLATLCNRMGRLWSEQTIEIFYETQPSSNEEEEVIPETPQPPPILMPDMETVASVLWHIWKAQNRLVFRQLKPVPDRVVQLALVHTRSIKCNNGTSSKHKMHTSDFEHMWCPPEMGVLKINIDGAYPTSPNKGTSLVCVVTPLAT